MPASKLRKIYKEWKVLDTFHWPACAENDSHEFIRPRTLSHESQRYLASISKSARVHEHLILGYSMSLVSTICQFESHVTSRQVILASRGCTPANIIFPLASADQGTAQITQPMSFHCHRWSKSPHPNPKARTATRAGRRGYREGDCLHNCSAHIRLLMRPRVQARGKL